MLWVWFAIYRDSKVLEHTIYGASRLGVYKRQVTGASPYFYELTDHLGNVRAVVSKETNETVAIKGATDYYPFGMVMPARNLQGDYRYAYQGQEKDPETGKEAFELRLWDSRIGRWLTTDPKREFSSPYLGMGNNPIKKIDPDGGSTEEWKPVVSTDGSVSYIAEAGDTVQSFAQQYGISMDQASSLIDANSIEAGVTTVSGTDVGNMFNGNQILKLDLTSGLATGQRKWDQHIFASDLSKDSGQDNYKANQFFSNLGYIIKGKANFDYGTGNALVYYEIPVRRTSTFDGSGMSMNGIGVTNAHSKFQGGTLFDGQNSNIRLPLYHPVTNNKFATYELIIHRVHDRGVMNRLGRTFSDRSRIKFLD